MRKFALMVVLAGLFTGSIATGASYQQRDGTVVDPIPGMFNSTHPDNGPDLGPNATSEPEHVETVV